MAKRRAKKKPEKNYDAKLEMASEVLGAAMALPPTRRRRPH